MKRVDALRSLMGSGIQRVDLMADFDGEPINIDAGMAIKLYNYLDEDLPEAAPTCCQPGKAVDVWADPESDQKESEKVKPVRKRIDAGKVVALYKAGWKQKDIAEEIGCYESTISTCLKKARAEGKV